MNYSIFKDKKVCVFVPHQDDEINIVYGLLYKIKDIVKDIKVIYSTNGNYVVKERYRLQEGIRSLKKIGVSENSIVFMGYSDQIPEASDHLYHEEMQWSDKYKNCHTKTPYNNDYHFLKHNEHAIFNKQNFVNDIKEILEENMPDIIIGIDFDSHPDHRALSLSLEKALGVLLKEQSEYRPIVLKAFAYPTSYKGYDDYSYNNNSTKFKPEKNSTEKMQNPYYKWSDRVIFKNPPRATSYLFLKNICFYGLLEHKSQYILNRIRQVVNNDLIFFERNTNNLLFNAKKIKCSSGNVDFLSDFMLFDSTNILGGITKKTKFDDGFTILDKKDKDKKIEIEFNNKTHVSIIKMYFKPGTIGKKVKIAIIANNKAVGTFECNIESNIFVINDLNLKNIEQLTIQFDCSNEISIGEIELFENQMNIEYAWLEIDQNVHNDYYCSTLPTVGILTNTQKENFSIKKEKRKITLYNNKEVIDYIIIHKENKILLFFLEIINKLTLFCGKVYQKIIKEIRKLINKQ